MKYKIEFPRFGLILSGLFILFCMFIGLSNPPAIIWASLVCLNLTLDGITITKVS